MGGPTDHAATGAPHQLNISVSEEHVDDLLYAARSGDVDELQAALHSAAAAANEARGSVAATAPADQPTQTYRAVLEQARNEAGNTPLHYAAANGHEAVLSHLLPLLPLRNLLAQNDAGNTPLHWAALNGHLGAVRSLVRRIRDAEAQEPDVARRLNVLAHEREAAARRAAATAEARTAAADGSPASGANGRGASSHANGRAPHDDRAAGTTDVEMVDAGASQPPPRPPPAASPEASAVDDAQDDDDEAAAEGEAQTPLDREIWDVRNAAGRGPMSEAQMNGHEDVVRFLLDDVVGGGGGGGGAGAGRGGEAVRESEAKTAGEEVAAAATQGAAAGAR